MKRLSVFVLVGLALGAVTLPRDAPAEARSIRWDRVVGATPSRMSDQQRERAATIMRREFCYFGCSRSIARCLEQDPPSRTAQRLAGYVVRQVLEDRRDDAIRQGIQQRGLSAHPLELATIDLSTAQCIGPAKAPVTVVEYADFECPFCRIVSPILHKLVGSMRPNVRMCFKHFPVRGHKRALPTSLAALAAGRQGRFWQVHDALYATAPRLGDAEILASVRRAKVPDMARWERDRGDKTFETLIKNSRLEGLRNGVRGTPTLFINSKEYLGRKSEAELRDRLEEELDLVRGRQ